MEHTLPTEIQALVARGATFVVNHSGGKDSQAMTIYLAKHIPAAQLVIIHAELPEVDWEGIRDHIEQNSFGIPTHYCTAASTFFDMVERRGMFPSPENKQCTSDLKRTPIDRETRHISYRTGQKLFVQCEGIRADESPKRKQATPFKRYTRECKAGREIYTWMPIHSWSTQQVFDTIREAGQEPHWAYAAGMSRLSCCFCIMAKKSDLQVAAQLKPALFQRYVATERRLNVTMMMPKKSGQRLFLDEIVGQVANETTTLAMAA